MTASSDPRSELEPGYRIDPFAEQHRIGARDVIELWTREGVLNPDEAERRVSEILLVATDPGANLAGVCTTYLERSAQLRADLWHFRVFVAAAHRRSNIAASLAVSARDLLVSRYLRGEDTRGIGIVYVVESELLKRFVPQAQWPQTNFVFVGENARGDHVRVYYFPGALAPEPAQAST
jgi:hypothetical protein